MANLQSKSAIEKKLLMLNHLLKDLTADENALKIKINENETNSDVVELLFFQLNKVIATKKYLEQEKDMLFRKYVNYESTSDSSDSD